MVSAQDFVQVLRSTKGNKEESCLLHTPKNLCPSHQVDTNVNGDTKGMDNLVKAEKALWVDDNGLRGMRGIEEMKIERVEIYLFIFKEILFWEVWLLR